MAYKYEEITDAITESKVLKRTDDNGQIWFIPMIEANSDYQAYLADPTGTNPPTTPTANFVQS